MAALSARSSLPRHLAWLDVLRAGAALLVLVSHIRAFTLRDAAEQPALSGLGRLVFAFTGFGHEAVIVFFVLSGFLVTRSMRHLAAAGQWSLLRFGIERLTRIWVVLIPCLLLGGMLDSLGLSLAAEPGGAVHYGDLAVTAPHPPLARDGLTLLGNAASLQTIAVPVYGSNGPLWSLADEVWFYVLAALAFGAWQSARHRASGLLHLAGLLVVSLCLPWSVLSLFPVWLCGAACAFLGEGRTPRTRPHQSAAALGFLAALLACRLRLSAEPLVLDWGLGLATAWLLVSAAQWPQLAPRWSRPARRLSDLSYSLYLSHVPVLALLTTVVVGPRR